MSIERDETEKADFDEIINECSSLRARKMLLISIFV